MNRVFVGVGLGVVIGLIGVALLVSGYTALGIIVLVISASLALGTLTTRQQSSRSSSSGRGGFYGGAAGSTEGTATTTMVATVEETAAASTGAVVAASTEAVLAAATVVVAAGEVREGLRGVTARGWAGCYHAFGALDEGEGRR